jgi:GGDEF domain-containing protein
LQVTEKIRAAVERIVFQDKVIKLTASLGVASLDYNVI